MSTIIIDPGHGGADPGGGTNQYWKEKDLVLQISQYQERRFKELGISVSLTRATDITLTSGQRTNLVKASGAKYCISNHINAGGGEGAETIYSIYGDGKLANGILDAIAAAGQKKRRVFTRTLPSNPSKDYYFMHRETGNVQTVIVEYGFADNANDTQRLLEHWQEYAEAVVKAFCQHIGHPYKAPQKEKTALEKALDVFIQEGITTTPDYWLQNAVPGEVVKGEYAAIMIEKAAARINQLRK
ncbi:N-acetylmuramoyl-L-alanine amidase [Anaerosolibacter carboniphilus]|uniref:N-acetylmuramoyl-L-alanine amidase n=1 Tax=Anaerosolibacter carboniphilus TaxID=1417629 RepID=A0A841KND3_9FIRM|nr:N-acetylmuramoyl-L-alanine amidase [Anaerosolibacter carboniphilus]MBB6214947.1 N-acetylmuramoyl-L-alanine amidase [Anaerosolibacter carboniphilus]